MIGTLGPPFPGSGSEIVVRASEARIAGDAYWNAIVDRGKTKGLSAIIGPYTPEPRIGVWIEPEARRHGYGRLATGLGLELAFRNLQVPHVFGTSDRADQASRRLLDLFGFESLDGSDELRRLTRAEWIGHRVHRA